MEKLDDIMDKVGGFGMYQKVMLTLISLMYCPVGFAMFAPVFIFFTPPHRCFIPAVDGGVINASYGSSLLVAHIPYTYNDEGDLELDRCSRYKSGDNQTLSVTNINLTEECLDGWVYMDPEGRISATTEFNMVCGSAWKKPLLTSALIVGHLIGSIISGRLSDRFGRRIVCLFATFLDTAMLTICGFAPTYEVLFIAVVLSGMGHVFLMFSTFVLAQELVDKEHRSLVACGVNVACAGGYIALPVTAYLVADWRWILRFLALFSLLYIPYLWILPESPRWLVSRGRYDEACKLLRKIAKYNKTSHKILGDLQTNNMSLEEAPLQHDGSNAEENGAVRRKRSSSLRIILTNAVIRKRTIILCCLWSTACVCYYAFGYNTSNIGKNPYWNCFIAAALEIPAALLAAYSIEKIGRRFSTAAFFFLSGAFCGLTPVLRAFNTASLVFAMAVKFFTTSTAGLLCLYTSELYPTLLRNTGVGIASMSARISGLFAPFLIFAGENAGKYIPFYVMFAICVATSVLTLLLPETRQSSLPHTISDAVKLEQYRLFPLFRQRCNKRTGRMSSSSIKERVERERAGQHGETTSA